MPGRNTIRFDVEDGYYHVYNRGVEKRPIYLDSQDYGVYLSYLRDYLLTRNEKEIHKKLVEPGIQRRERDRLWKLILMKNYGKDITLLAYCLMPNHFHLFLRQELSGSLAKFMRSLNTRYVMYFNRKYQRVGHLFQSRYKAIVIDDEAHYLHISRYIHKQALETLEFSESGQPSSYPEYIGTRTSSDEAHYLHISRYIHKQALETLEFSESGQPSSYPEYIGTRTSSWVHPEEILPLFSSTNAKVSYQQFVAEYSSSEDESEDLDL